MALRVIEVYVKQPDQVDGAIRYAVEQLTSGEWKLREHIMVHGGTPEARRKFFLEADERLIIEDITTARTVFDPEQKANHIVEEASWVQPPPEETDYSSQMTDVDAVASVAEGYNNG